MKPARILVDALAARFGGTAYAAIQVADRLADDPAVEHVVVVTRVGSMIADGLRARPSVSAHRLPAAERFELSRRVAWESLGLARAIRRHRASAVLTWSGMLPRPLPVPTVCYLANPAPFLPRAGGSVRRLAIARTSRDAAALLVPTGAMAALAEPHLGRRPDVVALGIDHARFVPAARPGDDVLCVADFYPHKRHDTVLAAWAALPAPRPRLRLIGDPRVAPDHARGIASLVAAHRRLGTITVESRLGLPELLAAYSRARVLLMASERESFCMPLLEAQACGVPAVARDSPVLRETGGPGTTFVVGDEPSRWREALRVLLEDDTAHGAARAAGLAHAAGYGWDTTAERIREALVCAA